MGVLVGWKVKGGGAAAAALVAVAACTSNPPPVVTRVKAASPSPAATYTLPVATLPNPGGVQLDVLPRVTRPFSLLALVWDDPRDALDPVVKVRTRASASKRWSAWRILTADDDGPQDPPAGSRGHSAPLWVGPSDAVQVALQQPADKVKLPAGLRLALVDPGNPSQAPAPTGSGGVGVVPAVTAQAVRPGLLRAALRPTIVSRAGWHADERLRHTAPAYADEVHVVFIHHTVNPNGYACSQAPAIIRAIYEFHMREVRWDDIGYNFIVDRCGTIYEGRAGGVDQPVVGGHTMGFNTGSAGIAVLGTFGAGVKVPQAVIDAIARIAAWKLSSGRAGPEGKAALVSNDSASRYPKGERVILNTISGHRDAVPTECPGDALYAALPAIRAQAARYSKR
ncbi:peptidoglycan recognition protein [Peterkaempfera sp. SMS 1(5)a]|uniref:peptidoglycan recognition protein family protein n=1 Tax=Peterkaempfera podocarpi TaxID=3232308 RepID=UPI00366CE2D1